ncbi:MAG TPA: decaprenyl-phosphate phosphoribosyltransferase [Pyrinomonadaceae bacterium]
MEQLEIIQSGEAKEIAVAPLKQTARALVRSLRPHEWTKNLLVFSGLIFSRSLMDAHNVLFSIGGFIAFCLASSGVYLFNDLCDLEKDRRHPTKKNRPLASGALNVNLARLAMISLFAGAVVLAFQLSPAFALAIGIYLTLNLAYSLKLKHVVILDVIIISSGFVLRAVAGALVLRVEVSAWLVLCTSMVALLVGFGKRRHELVLLEENAASHRASLNDYSVEFLDAMMTICGGTAVLTYALYTMAEDTVSRFGTHNLLVTLPFVVYGVFRYLFMVHKRKEGGDPVQLLFRDRASVSNILLWILAVCAVIYLPSFWDKSLSFLR